MIQNTNYVFDILISKSDVVHRMHILKIKKSANSYEILDLL